MVGVGIPEVFALRPVVGCGQAREEGDEEAEMALVDCRFLAVDVDEEAEAPKEASRSSTENIVAKDDGSAQSLCQCCVMTAWRGSVDEAIGSTEKHGSRW